MSFNYSSNFHFQPVSMEIRANLTQLSNSQLCYLTNFYDLSKNLRSFYSNNLSMLTGQFLYFYSI